MAPTVDPPSAWMSVASGKSLARRLHFEQGKTRMDIGEGGICWGGMGHVSPLRRAMPASPWSPGAKLPFTLPPAVFARYSHSSRTVVAQ